MQLATKLGYGVGQLSDGVKQAAFSIFLFFYYNQVLGLSGSLAGTASLLALVVDGITDPMVGQLSDRFKSRWGRRHPFMLAGTLPFGAAMVLLFTPPAGLSELGLFGWMLGFAVLVRLLLTFFFVPHLSLGAEMAKGYHERTSLIGYRVFFSFVGQLATAVVGFVYFFPPSEAFPNGMLNAASYPTFGVFAGGIATAAMLWSVISTRSVIPLLAKPAPVADAMHPVFGFITVFSTLQRRAFRILFASTLLFMTIAGVTQTLIIYVGTYLFGFEPGHLAALATAPVIGIALGPTIARKLSRTIDKKHTMSVTVLVGSLIAFSPQFLFLSGLLEAMSIEARFAYVYATHGISQGFFIAYIIMIDSMLSDTIDEHQLATGRREEGLYFAARSLATKASYGLGSFVAGVALDIIQFPQGASPAEVPMEALTKLSIFAGPISMVLMILTIAISRHYPLSQERHAAIVRGINAADAGGT